MDKDWWCPCCDEEVSLNGNCCEICDADFSQEIEDDEKNSDADQGDK